MSKRQKKRKPTSTSTSGTESDFHSARSTTLGAMTSNKRIAIVGSGVSGIAALYALRNTEHEVHIFEANSRLGGHTNTVDWEAGSESTKVDTGFIVLNSFTYPNFIAFLKEIGVDTVDTEMSFSVTRDAGLFEWSGSNLLTLFAQKRNLFRPSFYRMVFDILRFNTFALELLESSDLDTNNMSIGDYLDQEDYSQQFRDDYLLPMTACVWSTGPEKCALDFPAVTLVRFMWNHHLLTVGRRPTWKTIPGGSVRYIDAVTKGVPASRIHLSTEVTAVEVQEIDNDTKKYRLQTPNSGASVTDTFDEVIFACHAPQTLSILGRHATPAQTRILSNFKTTPNIAYLHSDLSLLPKRPAAWASWNYLTYSTPTSETPSHLSNQPDSESYVDAVKFGVKDKSNSSANQSVTLTYNMNILQHIPVEKFGHVLVTLNPPHYPSKMHKAFKYNHPLYTPEAVKAQTQLQKINGSDGIHFAGAWMGYGFHEDGFTAGVRAGVAAGGSVPFELIDAKRIRGAKPPSGMAMELVKAIILLGVIGLRMFDLLLSYLTTVDDQTIHARQRVFHARQYVEGQTESVRKHIGQYVPDARSSDVQRGGSVTSPDLVSRIRGSQDFGKRRL